MKPLLKLLADNRGLGQFRAESGKDEATLYLYDVIVSDDYLGGVGAESFVKAMNDISSPTIHLRINSPGGDVFAARAMEQAIREHPSRVVAHIDGYAASAASYVALAADEVLISDGAFYMIHKAWTIAFGNSDDLMDVAGLLEKIDGTLVSTYARETGQDAEQIEAWMKDETWFTAAEAVEHGFADAVSEAGPKAQAKQWNLAAYENAPRVKKNDTEPEPQQEQAVIPTEHTDHLRRKLNLVSATA